MWLRFSLQINRGGSKHLLLTADKNLSKPLLKVTKIILQWSLFIFIKVFNCIWGFKFWKQIIYFIACTWFYLRNYLKLFGLLYLKKKKKKSNIHISYSLLKTVTTMHTTKINDCLQSVHVTTDPRLVSFIGREKYTSDLIGCIFSGKLVTTFNPKFCFSGYVLKNVIYHKKVLNS